MWGPGIGWQILTGMISALAACGGVGYWIDTLAGSSPAGLLSGLGTGVVVAIYGAVRLALTCMPGGDRRSPPSPPA